MRSCRDNPRTGSQRLAVNDMSGLVDADDNLKTPNSGLTMALHKSAHHT